MVLACVFCSAGVRLICAWSATEFVHVLNYLVPKGLRQLLLSHTETRGCSAGGKHSSSFRSCLCQRRLLSGSEEGEIRGVI